jgi:hypothetical protein
MLLILQAYVTGMPAAKAHTPSSNTCCKTSTPNPFLVLKQIIVLGPPETERLFTNCVLYTINKTIHIHFRSVGFCTQNITNIPFHCIHIRILKSHDGKHSFWNRNSSTYVPLHVIRCTTSIIQTTLSAGPQELMCCSNNRDWAWHNSRGDETVLQKSESSFLHSFFCGDLLWWWKFCRHLQRRNVPLTN